MNIRPDQLESWQHYGESFNLGPKVPAWREEEEPEETCWICGGHDINEGICQQCNW